MQQIWLLLQKNVSKVDQKEWCAMWEAYAKGETDYQEWQDKYRDFYFSIMDTSGWREFSRSFVEYCLLIMSCLFWILSGEGTIELDEFAAVNRRNDVSDNDCSEAFKLMSKVSWLQRAFLF